MRNTAAARAPLAHCMPYEHEILAEKLVPTRETEEGGAVLAGRALRDRFVYTTEIPGRPGVRGYDVSLTRTLHAGQETFQVSVGCKHPLRKTFDSPEKARAAFDGIHDWTTKTTLFRRGFVD